MASSHQPGWPDWPAYLDKFCLGFIWEISARFPRQGKAKDPGDESWCQTRETKQTTFAPIIASATLKVVSLQLWCSLSCGKYESNARQCHPERKNSSSLHPCNRAEVTLGTRGFSLSVSGFCQGFAARVNDLHPTKLFVAREKKTGSGTQGRMKCSYGKISSPVTEISVGKTEISGTEPARSLMYTHRKFYKVFRCRARFRKPGQPAGQLI